VGLGTDDSRSGADWCGRLSRGVGCVALTMCLENLR
jgi:hypothetical protein